MNLFESHSGVPQFNVVHRSLYFQQLWIAGVTGVVRQGELRAYVDLGTVEYTPVWEPALNVAGPILRKPWWEERYPIAKLYAHRQLHELYKRMCGEEP